MISLSLLPPWARWAALAAVVAGIAWAGWTVNGWRQRAAEAAAAEQALADYQRQVAERDAEQARDIALDEASRAALASTRTRIAELLAELAQKPVTEVVYRERIVNGQPCPDPRISPDWLRHYNEVAAAGSPAQ